MSKAFLDFVSDSRVADMNEEISDLKSHSNVTVALEVFGGNAAIQTLITINTFTNYLKITT